MVRQAQYLVFVIHLVVTPRTMAEALSSLISPQPSATREAAAPVNVCPCTGAAGCDCCGCCDDANEPVPQSEAGDKSPQDKSEDAGRKITRCTCKPQQGLASSSDYLPSPLRAAVHFSPSNPESVLTDADCYASAFLPIDIPPPKGRG